MKGSAVQCTSMRLMSRAQLNGPSNIACSVATQDHLVPNRIPLTSGQRSRRFVEPVGRDGPERVRVARRRRRRGRRRAPRPRPRLTCNEHETCRADSAAWSRGEQRGFCP